MLPVGLVNLCKKWRLPCRLMHLGGHLGTCCHRGTEAPGGVGPGRQALWELPNWELRGNVSTLRGPASDDDERSLVAQPTHLLPIYRLVASG